MTECGAAGQQVAVGADGHRRRGAGNELPCTSTSPISRPANCCAITWRGGPPQPGRPDVSRPGANSCPARLCSARCGRSWSAAGGGFVLDGIPRNMHQARAAYLIGRELGMTADVALHLQVDDRGTHAPAARAGCARASLGRHRRHHVAARPGRVRCATRPGRSWPGNSSSSSLKPYHSF